MINWILKRIGNLIGLLLILGMIVWVLFMIAFPYILMYWVIRG